MKKFIPIILALVLTASGPKVLPPAEKAAGEAVGYWMMSVDELSKALKN